MQWRVLAGVSEVPVGLVTVNERFRSFSDLTGTERIALPQPGSIQHILLAIAAEREWGDPRYFDERLVSLAHPDGVIALLAGRDIDAHFTTPPYLFEELADPRARLLLSGTEAFGGRFTFIVTVAAPEFGDDRSENQLVEIYRAELARAIEEISEIQRAIRRGDSVETIGALAAFYDLEPDVLARYLAAEGMRYTDDVVGLERFARVMNEYGYIEDE
jgi:NitT/TauT family transport system substrate-binding protein